jgi:hypothetical protein
MTKKPRVLFWDVETSPILAWIWRPGRKVFISHEQIKKGQVTDIITICWKWLGERELHSLDWDIKKQDSSKMIEEFTKVIESADLIVAQNGDAFDMKQLNTQRLLHGQGPISWPTSEDTLKQLRKYFAFPSFKLDYIAKALTGAGKAPMGWQDWVDIVENKNSKALDKMIRYCKRDVVKLEQVFKKISKFCAPKVNMSIVTRNAQDGCPRCGVEHIQSKGIRVTLAGRYRQFQCMKCRHQFRSRNRL